MPELNDGQQRKDRRCHHCAMARMEFEGCRPPPRADSPNQSAASECRQCRESHPPGVVRRLSKGQEHGHADGDADTTRNEAAGPHHRPRPDDDCSNARELQDCRWYEHAIEEERRDGEERWLRLEPECAQEYAPPRSYQRQSQKTWAPWRAVVHVRLQPLNPPLTAHLSAREKDHGMRCTST